MRYDRWPWGRYTLSMQWRREEYLALMTHGRFDRPMFCELFGPLIGLAEEWREQGASQDEIDMVAFDWDYVPIAGCGGSAMPLAMPPVTISETEEELIQRDYLGRMMKLCKRTATIALPMDFPVKTMDDWLRVKPLFQWRADRVRPADVAAAKSAQAAGTLVVAHIPGAYALPRDLMGEEELSLAYYDQPELIADIIQTMSDTAFAVLERVSREVTIDQLSVHEDFAGRSGPLAGPAQIRQTFRPYYRRIWEMLSSRGTKIFQQDTDGNVNAVIDDLLDCGLTCVYPMEPAAGMDIVALHKKYGTRLATLGGIDKHVLRKDKAAIRSELEYKMPPLMRQGGCVFGLDHRIPNGTSIENYRFYVDIGREILGLPQRDPAKKGWRRMAF